MEIGIINHPQRIMWHIWFERLHYILNWGVIQSTCFVQVNVSFIKIPRNFVLVIGTICFSSCVYRVSQEEWARLREGVPYVKVYRYKPKHLCPKLNGYGDNGQRKVWSSCASTHCYPPVQTLLSQLTVSVLACGVKLLLVSRDKRLHMGFTLASR